MSEDFILTEQKLDLSVFRQGDIRGIVPTELNSAFAYQFGLAYASVLQPTRPIALGRDQRESSTELQSALSQGLLDAGIDVIDIGLCPTELIYFSASLPEFDGGIMVTASHNPAAYNGFKPVSRGATPIMSDSGLGKIRKLMMQGHLPAKRIAKENLGQLHKADMVPRYVKFVHSCFTNFQIDGLNLALNGVNGCAAILANPLFTNLGITVDWLKGSPRSDFPKEGANPIGDRHLKSMRTHMQQGNYAMGLAWDGDADRCLFFDNNGAPIETYYIIGLLIQASLSKYPAANIVFDAKLCWNTMDLIKQFGGQPHRAVTGHAFVKQKMAQVQAQYGGEHSAHHYFKQFSYCDSGMFPWLTLLEYQSTHNVNLMELVVERRTRFQVLPEINVTLENLPKAYQTLHKIYYDKALNVDSFDGVSYEFNQGWRFNIRASNTEPLIRLNFESRAGSALLLEQAREVLQHLKPMLACDFDIDKLLSETHHVKSSGI